VPRCVNVNHLFLGTPADNIRDCWEKGRHPHAKGEGSTRHKFTDDAVLLCRQLHLEGYMHREIAELVGMSAANVGAIVRRETWDHI
jgi:hypothetical protein